MMKAPEVYELLEQKLQDAGLLDLLQQMRQAVETAAAKEKTPVVKRITKSKTQLYFAEVVERRQAGDTQPDNTGNYTLAASIADALNGGAEVVVACADDEVREVVELGLAVRAIAARARPTGFVALNFDDDKVTGRFQNGGAERKKVGTSVVEVLKQLMEEK